MVPTGTTARGSSPGGRCAVSWRGVGARRRRLAGGDVERGLPVGPARPPRRRSAQAELERSAFRRRAHDAGAQPHRSRRTRIRSARSRNLRLVSPLGTGGVAQPAGAKADAQPLHQGGHVGAQTVEVDVADLGAQAEVVGGDLVAVAPLVVRGLVGPV